MISLGRWQFDFTHPLLDVLVVLLLISFLLNLRSVQQRLLHRVPLRALTVMLLSAVAYGSVFLLLLEPRIYHTAKQSIVLITEGADLVQNRLPDTASRYVAPGVSTSEKNLVGADWLLDIEQLNLREPALSAIEVLGFGLDQQQWQHFSDDIQVDFSPPAVNGFTKMQWRRYLLEGETFAIRGHYQQIGTDSIIQLKLLDPAGNIVDETRLKGNRSFSLVTRIKTRGNLEYKLQSWSAGILQSEQLLPINADSGTPLNIMIDFSAPSFETRALNNYAAANGHPILLNTNISRDKYINQSANLPVDVDPRLSPQVLAGQDILIMDGRALVNLPSSQRQWLTDAVEKGLGLLLLADASLLENFGELNTKLLDGFHLSSLADVEVIVIPRLRTTDHKNWQEPLTVAAMRLGADDADVLIDDGRDRPLVLKRAKGLGHIGISLISHSHNWLTAGHLADWSDYWSALFDALARQRNGSFLLAQAETDFYRINQRTAICAFTTEKNSSLVIRPASSAAQQTAYELQLVADQLNSPRQCVYFWPEVSGWHQLQLVSASQGSILDQKSIYIFDTNQWLAQQRSQRVQATDARALNSKTGAQGSTEKWLSESLSPFWLWLTLVLSGTFLWLERKLDFG